MLPDLARQEARPPDYGPAGFGSHAGIRMTDAAVVASCHFRVEVGDICTFSHISLKIAQIVEEMKCYQNRSTPSLISPPVVPPFTGGQEGGRTVHGGTAEG